MMGEKDDEKKVVLFKGSDAVETLDQSPKILQQILRTMPVGGGNQVNIIYYNNIVGKPENGDGSGNSLFELLENLPKPRFQRLQERIVQEAMKKFEHNRGAVAEWLGISKRTVYNVLKRGGEGR